MQPDLKTFSQSSFANTLLDSNLPMPSGIVDPEGLPAPKRFNVYRNNVIVSLVDAMCDAFPAIVQITGLEFFRAVAREYVSLNPPTSPLMMFYGAGFDDFLSRFGPTQNMPFLPDVARIELCWRTAYHAADLEPINAESLAKIPQERLESTVFGLHPAVSIVPSDYSATDIWHVGRGLMSADKMSAQKAQTTLICRPEFDVLVETLDPATAALLTSIDDGATFGDAVETALNKEPNFDLSGFIGTTLRLGLLTRPTTKQQKEVT